MLKGYYETLLSSWSWVRFLPGAPLKSKGFADDSVNPFFVFMQTAR